MFKLNISDIITKTKLAINKKSYRAKEDVRKLLDENCSLICHQYDPFVGELKSLYAQGSNILIYKEDTCQIKDNVHECFKLKVLGQYKKQLFYIKVPGARLK